MSDIHTSVPSLAGKAVLITGGTTGIGRATAALLGSYGANVFIFGRHEEELADALAHIRAQGGACEGTVADAAKRADVDRVFAEADRYLGALDVLVNNAGIGGDGLLEASDQDWRYVIETDLTGYLACAKAALERMKTACHGHIVQIGSISADERGGDDSVYVAAKAGVQGFSEALRKAAAEHGVRVSLIEPGSVGTDMTEDDPATQRKKIAAYELLRAEDVAVSVHYVLTQPERCVITSLRIEPLHQG